MKMCPVSIYGGGVASELLKGLGPDADAVSHSEKVQATWHLGRCYRFERGMWDGSTYTTRRVATGGLRAWVWFKGFEECHSKFHRTLRLHIRPGDVPKASNRLNRWITRLLRESQAERYRLEAVGRLDALCKPYLEVLGFMDWVTEQEKVFGESDYSKLTIEDCDKWTDAIRKWTQENGKPFNVNPSRQASATWAM